MYLLVGRCRAYGAVVLYAALLMSVGTASRGQTMDTERDEREERGERRERDTPSKPNALRPCEQQQPLIRGMVGTRVPTILARYIHVPTSSLLVDYRYIDTSKCSRYSSTDCCTRYRGYCTTTTR